jgi:hypothetical protein
MITNQEYSIELRLGNVPLRDISGSEIIEWAEALKRGAELRLQDIERRGRSRWDRETETRNKLNCSRIISGVRDKGLQETNFKVGPSMIGENLMLHLYNQETMLRQIQEKETRHEISGRDLIERIDKETSFLESCVSGTKQLDTIRQAQKEYSELVKSKLPEKDIAAVIRDRISTLKKNRVVLQGLENDSFTLPRNDIYSIIRHPEFIKKVDKLSEVKLTGRELTKRIDGELEYFRECIDTQEKRERLRAVQSVYKTTPEKDVVKIVEDKITDLEVARLSLMGLEKATFTVKGRDNIHSIVKSPDFAKQIKRENGRFVSRDR